MTADVEVTRPLREPLAEALGVELRRLDIVVLRVWQLLGLVGVVSGTVLALTVSRGLGAACALASFPYLVWFLLARRLLLAGRGGRWLRVGMDAVEASIPWVFTVVLLVAQGARYTLASWVPPVLFCTAIIANTARLRALASLMAGVTGALLYLVLYFLLVRRSVPLGSDLLLYQPSMQVTRALSLVVAGVLGWFLCRWLTSAIGRAETAVRERDLFGKYQILRRVAAGGTAVVFEALYCPEGGFQRRVAVKQIHSHLAIQKRFVERFRAEAELSARLAHPNIIQVMDFGRIAKSYFLAMELVEGPSLAAFMAEMSAAGRKVPPHLVGYIVREILSGLVHAHEVARGNDGQPLRVVHRDLCPANVLLSVNGEVKIADFGIARALQEADSAHTQTIEGHLAYMAPEQARAEPVDTRTDLFPVGVILWELLCGRRLFKKDSQAAAALAVVSEEAPAVTSIRSDVDLAWDALVARALAKKPDDRFSSAREMAAKLDAIAESHRERSSAELAALVDELGSAPGNAGEP